MTWPIAIFGIFSVLIVSTALFLLVVYFKEYSREEKMIKEFRSRPIDQSYIDLPVVLIQPPKQKKSAISDLPKIDTKNKKDIN